MSRFKVCPNNLEVRCPLMTVPTTRTRLSCRILKSVVSQPRRARPQTERFGRSGRVCSLLPLGTFSLRVVGTVGFKPTLSRENRILGPACLSFHHVPIEWCPRGELNPYVLRQRVLSPSRLPIPPPGQEVLNEDLRVRIRCLRPLGHTNPRIGGGIRTHDIFRYVVP